ncbi:MAG: hypothetical protein U0745_12820 [Polyangia bacterium]|jgi:hypothetical protein
MQNQAIEQRLRDRPSDEATWDSYAAWLTQTGDVRGTLIQLERSRQQTPNGTAQRRELDEQIQQLTSNTASWTPKVPTGTILGWQHGFVVDITLTLDASTADTLRQILRDPQSRLLHSLRLQTERKPDEGEEEEEWDEESLSKLPEPTLMEPARALASLDLSPLRALSFPYCLIGAEGVRAILHSPQLGKLKSLDLRYCYLGDEGAQVIAQAAVLSELESLRLQRNGLTPRGFCSLADSPNLHALRLLDLRYNAPKTKGIEALASSTVTRTLQTLLLHRKETTKAGARALATSPHLPLSLRRFWSAQ